MPQGAISERGAPLVESDSVGPEEARWPRARFYQALRVREEWFVQFELAEFAGVRTVGYVPDGQGGFHRWPGHNFGGPACETIKAALRGVSAFGVTF